MKYAVLLSILMLTMACATAPADPDASGEIQITGVITSEGVECPAVRGDDGKIYTLATGTNVPAAGTRVRVTGEVAEVSTCMQGTTISVRSIDPL